MTLYSPKDYRPPDSSVHGILQARILGWVAIPFSRGSSQPRLLNLDLLHCSWTWKMLYIIFLVLKLCHQKIERASMIFIPPFSKDNIHSCLFDAC